MQISHGPKGRMQSNRWNTGSRVALTIGLATAISLVASPVRAQTVTACVNSKSGAVTIRSSLQKGSCPKGTQPIALVSGTAPTLTVQTLNVVDANNHTIATLGKTATGNHLTFFDSSGNRTMTVGNNVNESFAGLATFDNNNVIAGTGVVRTVFGESNPNAGATAGFGASVFDGDSVQLSGFGPSFDLSNNGVSFTDDASGSSAGIGTFQHTNFAGYFASDPNGTSRQSGGLSLDGTTNIWLEQDPNGTTRVSASQVTPNFVNSAGRGGNAFVIWDQNGLEEASMGAATDGSLAGFNVVDPNNIDRFRRI
jgi:hypothetical protein